MTYHLHSEEKKMEYYSGTSVLCLMKQQIYVLIKNKQTNKKNLFPPFACLYYLFCITNK